MVRVWCGKFPSGLTSHFSFFSSSWNEFFWNLIGKNAHGSLNTVREYWIMRSISNRLLPARKKMFYTRHWINIFLGKLKISRWQVSTFNFAIPIIHTNVNLVTSGAIKLLWSCGTFDNAMQPSDSNWLTSGMCFHVHPLKSSSLLNKC